MTLDRLTEQDMATIKWAAEFIEAIMMDSRVAARSWEVKDWQGQFGGHHTNLVDALNTGISGEHLTNDELAMALGSVLGARRSNSVAEGRLELLPGFPGEQALRETEDRLRRMASRRPRGTA